MTKSADVDHPRPFRSALCAPLCRSSGVALMRYSTFLFNNIIGGILWITSLVYAGYLFGNIALGEKQPVADHRLAILAVSVLPIVIKVCGEYRRSKRSSCSDRTPRSAGNHLDQDAITGSTDQNAETRHSTCFGCSPAWMRMFNREKLKSPAQWQATSAQQTLDRCRRR